MVTAQSLLGVSLFALLILETHCFPAKGPKPQSNQGQSSSIPNAGGNFASRQGAATGHYEPTYSAFSDVPRPGPLVRPAPSSSFVQTAPAPGSFNSNPEAGYPGTGFVPAHLSYPAQAAHPAGAGFVPPQVGYPASVLVVPVQAAYDASSTQTVPVQAGYGTSSTQTEGSQSNLPETKWAVVPNIFSEEGLASTQSYSPSSFIPPPPPPPPVPVLQSGETSSVVKEAELGNYQHETEEFGYPAAMGSGQGLASNPMSYVGGGGYWGSPYPALRPVPYPYPNFDYRLLYGMYPPGTYSTFSKNKEKGKDYYQELHYLKEHGSDNPNAPRIPQSPGYGQQKKRVFSPAL